MKQNNSIKPIFYLNGIPDIIALIIFLLVGLGKCVAAAFAVSARFVLFPQGIAFCLLVPI